ncbi:hypothetical protein [Streptomyces sp. Isolate_219]|uniref:hypothetical protein n=1 Tax=Streptomyces sp. Isolate_219 TaxID=2950110 RepID=UPI0021C7209F|nr:hypothetical protein [Streptomyces sp. Isolate_219]MCR8574152.1 hypothetical protein [Streptomyces sp. Isolate_219]
MRALQERVDQLQAAQLVLRHLLECPGRTPIRDCPYLRDEFDEAVDTALGLSAAVRDERGPALLHREGDGDE